MMRPLSWAAAAASLVLAAATAAADPYGINLSLNDCGTFGTLDAPANCSSNSGFALDMVASVRMPVAVTHFAATEIYIDVLTSGTFLSSWWTLDGCRLSALTFSADFGANPTSCADPWAGLAGWGGAVAPNHRAANHFTIQAVIGLSTETTLVPGTEYSLVRVRVSRAKSTGTGSCAGCNDAACLVLHGVELQTAGGVDDWRLCQVASRNYVTYNSGVLQAGESCPASVPDTYAEYAGGPQYGTRCMSLPVPALNRTWGQIKSQYR